MHNHFVEHDQEVSHWMATNVGPVTYRHYDFDREILAWRHFGTKVKYTLRIHEDVLAFTPPDVLIGFLDSARVAEAIQHFPTHYFVVMHSQSGNIVIRKFSSLEQMNTDSPNPL